ncbi:MAG: hypothetical protein IKW38_07475 [Kiritimatiellae bacterium]|nr:hypothetical protein [Kiritimatiellia bacterium]
MKLLGKIVLTILLSLIGLMALAAIAFTTFLYIGGCGDANTPTFEDADLYLTYEALLDEDNAFVHFAAATNHYAVLSDNQTDDQLDDYRFLKGYSKAFPEKNSFHQRARNEPQSAARADAILASHSPLFALLSAGIQCKGYRTIPAMEAMPKRFEPLATAQFVDYGALLCLKAQRELERGDLESATQTIELLHAFGKKMLTHTDGLLTSLVGKTLKQMAYQKMIDAAGMGLLTDEITTRFSACVNADLQTLQAEHERTLRAEYTVVTVRMEQFTVEQIIAAMDALQNALQQVFPDEKPTFTEQCTAFLNRTILRWPGYLRFSLHPCTTRVLLADIARKALQGCPQESLHTTTSNFTPNHLGTETISTFAETCKGMANSAKQDAFFYAKTQLILATIKWQQRNHDAFPPSLEALVPEYLPAVPIDPLSTDARPLAYHPATGTVWTVGEAGEFDYLEYLKATPLDQTSGTLRYQLQDNAFRLDGRPHPHPSLKRR